MYIYKLNNVGNENYDNNDDNDVINGIVEIW